MKRIDKSNTVITMLTFFTILIIALPINLYAQEDTTPPSVLSFSFTPTTVDISTSPQTFTSTMRITDDISGFNWSSVYFRSPSLGQSVVGQFGLISGDELDGMYEASLTIPLFSEAGIWRVSQLIAGDNTGNNTSFNESDLIALGFPTELEVISEHTIDTILDFFDESVADGTLEGHGRGNSANGRLNALRNMLEMAGDLIAIDDIEGACRQLNAALRKCDGESRPPDFVTGEVVTDLYDMILELIDELGCEEI